MNFLRNNYKYIGLGLSASIPATCWYYKNKPKKYTYQEIATHNSIKDGIWTTYKDKVYDITDFIDSHPGGKDKIMLAAGSSLETYWNYYKQHQKQEVYDILESMKIGEIKDYNPMKFKDLKDAYLEDPVRNPNLKIHSIKPFNAETPKEEIHINPLTSTENWYVRNHNPVPIIKPEEYQLSFIYDNKKPIKNFTLEELKKMPSKKVITTIQCGGNRRGEFEKTSGTQWGIGAISTAEWEGVPLCNILKGYRADHIHFEGYDGVKSSIPFRKGRNCFGDVLVAYKMNGEELPADHGYPVRIIVPGYVGIKNIKWLKKITLSNEEVDGPWQRGMAYKILPGSIRCLEDVSKIDLKEIDTIEELPIQSCITHIEEIYRTNDKNLKICSKNFRIHGYTYSSKPMEFPRVDVSIDGGKTWNIAGVNPHFKDLQKFKWGWALWSIDVKIDKTPCEVICMASDNKGNVQPRDIKDIWNIRGLANNSVHKENII
tara:strand:+ start:55 stop:1512 length:1458 start_codon:yes stop_codon:yes gene_type:complete